MFVLVQGGAVSGRHTDPMGPGDVVSIIGVGLTLYGTARGLGPHGGARALLPPRGVHAARWVRTRPGVTWRWFERTVLGRHRDTTVQATVATGSAASVLGRVEITAEGIVIPNPVTDTEEFIGRLASQFGAVSGDLAAVRRELDQERTARAAAEQQLQAALAAGLETNAAEIKHLDLSGLRWQFVGATFVIVGIAVDAISA